VISDGSINLMSIDFEQICKLNVNVIFDRLIDFLFMNSGKVRKLRFNVIWDRFRNLVLTRFLADI
jgi:hypothetical protein